MGLEKKEGGRMRFLMSKHEKIANGLCLGGGLLL